MAHNRYLSLMTCNVWQQRRCMAAPQPPGLQQPGLPRDVVRRAGLTLRARRAAQGSGWCLRQCLSYVGLPCPPRCKCTASQLTH